MSSISPDFANALDRYEAGDLDRAAELCQALLQREPSRLDALNLLGGIAYRQRDWHLALQYYQTIVRIYPRCAVGYANFARTLQEIDRLEEAVLLYGEALHLEENRADWHFNLGNAYWDLGDIDIAIEHFEKTLHLDRDFPEVRGHLALNRLLKGNFQQGFADYEGRPARLRLSETFPHPERIWDGSNEAGKTLLLLCEQGFGDAIQFVRYVPILKARGARVLVRCRWPLVRLFETIPGIDRVLSIDEALPNWDAHALLMSLPFLLGTRADTIPRNVPYLSRLPLDCELDASLNGTIDLARVGLVWSGSPTHRKDRDRSISFDLVRPLLDIPGFRFYSLQKDPKSEEAKALAEDRRICDLSRDLKDFGHTAAIIDRLDLVIAVDTSVAHLAGAMGKPVWVLLSKIPDWRWGLHDDRSSWYPTMQLFRQSRRGEWDTVLEQVQHALLRRSPQREIVWF
ncbi:MAG: tetratricopeptide repeat protein [Cyanobacteria bacterium SID2]|nr:tetratricopeptide repeat protein [Cyanobacteria bacterium SID2]MBP0004471.1 tetratricopeptide repeat protein [Cyanobacteria bacterium SBC]